MEAKYCLLCGHPLVEKVIDGDPRQACSACSYVHWGNYSVGVGALVIKEGKLLLVRRAQEPGKGYWTNPGGYIEQHELIDETVRREVREESGVDARVTGIVAVRDQPRAIHNLYIAFAMEYIGGEPTPDHAEVDAAGFFSLEEMATMNVADFTRWLVDVAVRAQDSGLTAEREVPASLSKYGLYRV
ncbi:NUDIX hydrolase [Xylanibacillus composti]|uniref:NUDIX hydrolase n=1 Tax=Xylanibacillus composti TaxID=1572762 RepID=A0A8J4H5L4_9BACL|nr:NUDIX hydrolase [Xylanibacillus composti]MDT9726452.1 NUDIX hydrolase [Xylanibacillus composti]GIQ71383.1 NUDIX hydrolase [Xylanibacillus composti]